MALALEQDLEHPRGVGVVIDDQDAKRCGVSCVPSLVLVALAGPAGQAGDGGRQFGRIDGLGDVRLEAGEQGPFPVLGAGEGGEGGGRDILLGRIVRPHLADQIIPVLLGHANIADDHVGAELLDQLQGLGRRRGEGHLRLAVVEDAADELAGVGLVIDHEHLEAGEGTFLTDRPPSRRLPWAGPSPASGRSGWTTVIGSVTVKVAPWPSPGLLARMLPPCISTSCLTMASPRPRPPCRRVVRGVGLAEAVEDVRQEFGLDAHAGVDDADLDVRVDPLQQHLHLAALGRELHGVGEQVPDDLLEPCGVAGDGARERVEHLLDADALGVGRRHARRRGRPR